MVKIQAFTAFRPTEKYAKTFISVPYDVLNRDEAAEIVSSQPENFLKVTRSEVDFPSDYNPYAAEVYEKARESWLKLQEDGVVAKDEEPSCYLYRLTMGEHVQTGVVATFSTENYRSGTIVKHEKTRQKKEDDRTNHILTTRAQTGSVFLTSRFQAELKEYIAQETQEKPPAFDVTTDDGVRHELWRVTETEWLSDIFAAQERVYIADGHHRAASANRVSETYTGSCLEGGDKDFMLGVVFDVEEMNILPYHRLITTLNELSSEQFLARLESQGSLVKLEAQPSVTPSGTVQLYLGGQWYQWDLPHLEDSSVKSSLEAERLQELVLGPILDIVNIREDERVGFVGGIRGFSALEEAVDSGEAAVAIALPAVTVDQLLEIADAGEVMPPKSTWFEPKLRDGVVVHAW